MPTKKSIVEKLPGFKKVCFAALFSVLFSYRESRNRLYECNCEKLFLVSFSYLKLKRVQARKLGRAI